LSSQPFGRPSPCPPLPTILERWAFIQSRSLHFSLICCCEVATKSSPPPQCFDRQGKDLVAASQQQHQLKEYKWPRLAIAQTDQQPLVGQARPPPPPRRQWALWPH
jgi:hypothetical protein